MDKNYNYNFENRHIDSANKISSEILNMNSCKESDLPKNPEKDRFYHTTDTNKFFYDWNGKRYQMNLFGGESSDELIKEIEKIKKDIAKLDPDKIAALETKVNDATKKANDAATKAQEAASTISDKASTEYVDNKFAEVKSITDVESVENGYNIVLSDGLSISVKNGADGAKGDKGDTGETGPQGPKGDKGDTGETGPQGPKGDKGDTGETGPQGEKGADGAKGDKGDTGETGPQGPKGDKGDTGAAFTYDMFTTEQLASLKGPKGDKGDTGETGPQGPKGDKGDTGEKGADGVGLTDEDKVKLEKLDSIPDNLNEGTFPTLDDSGNETEGTKVAGLATVDKVVAYVDEVLKKKSSDVTESKEYVYISGSRYVDDKTSIIPIYIMNCFEIDADTLDENKGIEIISGSEIGGYYDTEDPNNTSNNFCQLFAIDVPDGYEVDCHLWDDDTQTYFSEIEPIMSNPRYSQKTYGDKTYDCYVRKVKNVYDENNEIIATTTGARRKIVLKKKNIKDVFTNGGSITLVDNTEITEPLTLADGKSVVLNLGGKTLTHSGGVTDADCSTIKITNGTLTVDGNGTIDGGTSDYTERNVIWAKGTNSKVIIKGGNFKMGEYTGSGKGWYDCIYGNAGSTIEIYGGTFENKNSSRPACLNIQNTGDKSNIIVYGGKFINYDPSTGDDKLGGTFVADGYESVKISDSPMTYEVKKIS